jgi:hypothetical protein
MPRSGAEYAGGDDGDSGGPAGSAGPSCMASMTEGYAFPFLSSGGVSRSPEPDACAAQRSCHPERNSPHLGTHRGARQESMTIGSRIPTSSSWRSEAESRAEGLRSASLFHAECLTGESHAVGLSRRFFLRRVRDEVKWPRAFLTEHRRALFSSTAPRVPDIRGRFRRFARKPHDCLRCGKRFSPRHLFTLRLWQMVCSPGRHARPDGFFAII